MNTDHHDVYTVNINYVFIAVYLDWQSSSHMQEKKILY